MKKIIFLFLMSCLGMKAQNWCPPGATWHYAFDRVNFSMGGVVEYKYTGDTLINSISCKKIIGAFSGSLAAQSTFTFIPSFETYYSYESNKVVYLYHAGTFDTVVDYKANIGNKWRMLRLPLDAASYCDTNVRRPFTVIDTGHVIINSVNLRKIVVTYSPSSTFGVNTFTFIEKIRNITASYDQSLLFPLYCTAFTGSNEGQIISFRCYHDNNFPLYSVVPYGCDSRTGIRLIDGNEPGISIYPNPVSNKLHIEGVGQLSEVVIVNALSQTVLEVSGPQIGEEIDMSKLQPGSYFITITRENQNIQARKLIIAR